MFRKLKSCIIMASGQPQIAGIDGFGQDRLSFKFQGKTFDQAYVSGNRPITWRVRRGLGHHVHGGRLAIVIGSDIPRLFDGPPRKCHQ